MLTQENIIIHLVDCPLGHVLRLGWALLGNKSEIVKAIVPRPDFGLKLQKVPYQKAFISYGIDDVTGLYHGVIMRRKSALEMVIDSSQRFAVMVQSPHGHVLQESALLATSKEFPVLPVMIVENGRERYEYWGWDGVIERRSRIIREAEDKRRAKQQKRKRK